MNITYDTFLVVNAVRHGVSVVELTDTLTALYQRIRGAKWATYSSHFARCSQRFLGRFKIRQELTTSSQFVKRFVDYSDSKFTPTK